MSARYGFVIDLDRCTGCGACMVACAAENNVPPAPAGHRSHGVDADVGSQGFEWHGGASARGFHSHRLHALRNETPCVSVCPQQAVEVDKATGIVVQMPQRCLGCRYCMTACPYHARYFNWWDPAGPRAWRKVLIPGVAVRMRGVVEKCNMCPARLHSAREKAAAAGKKKSILPTTSPPARKRVPPGPSYSGTWRTKTIPSSPRRILPTPFGCWRGSARNPRFTTNPSRPG